MSDFLTFRLTPQQTQLLNEQTPTGDETFEDAMNYAQGLADNKQVEVHVIAADGELVQVLQPNIPALPGVDYVEG